MKNLFNTLLSVGLLFAAGCSSVSTDQTETTADGAQRHTRVVARTFFDSKSELAKLKTTATDKTQGVAISGLSQESGSTNIISLVDTVVGAAVRAAR